MYLCYFLFILSTIGFSTAFYSPKDISKDLLPSLYFESFESFERNGTFYSSIIIVKNFPQIYLKTKYYRLFFTSRRNSTVDPWFTLSIPYSCIGNGGIINYNNVATVTSHVELASPFCSDSHICDQAIIFLQLYNREPPAEDDLTFNDVPPNMMDRINITQQEHKKLTIQETLHPDINSDTFNDNDRMMSSFLQESVEWANTVNVQSHLHGPVLQQRREPAFGGARFHLFFNIIGTLPELMYLEVGVFNGSSLFSVLNGNQATIRHAVAVDSWRQQDAPFANTATSQIRDSVVDALQESGYGSLVHLVVGSCWELEPGAVTRMMGGKANVYFYDAGHSPHDHFSSLVHFLHDLADSFIFLVDDWNWLSVQSGTLAAIDTLPVEVVSKIVISTGRREGHEWNNGLACFVLKKM